MADTKQTPRDEPEPAATEAETVADAAPEESAPAGPADDAGDDTHATDADQTDAEADADAGTPATDGPTTIATPDDTPAGPYPTRVGWVVAAFLFFWPLAIPALVQSMRTAEANGTGNARRAKKSSVRTLDFALGAVVLGALGIVGLVIGVAAAPTYASSLPPGFVAAAKSFVPPALAGPLGITLPDDGAPVAAPTSSPEPTNEPYPTAATDLPSDPYAEPLPEDSVPEPMPEAGEPEPTDEPTPASGATATAGAEIPDLEVGDCIDTSATSGQTTLYRIPVVSCTTAHGGEIYAETTAPDSLAGDRSTPTQQALWDAADAYCYPQFAEFVGMRWAKSELLYWPIAPSEASWAEGDRRILCVIESERPVTGSLAGAER
ncbi:septum formation family protein [Promicromonospora panici]|uniref:septum formation family protein n=1 Tax=Promicromonospora panici TaxID=2219658 RepID=UPI00101DCB08|nr:septum formation family protein [Promicromonospora panici]